MQWESLFNLKASRIGPSIIAEMAGLVSSDGISFTSGEPSADLIPHDGLKAAFRKAIERASLFSYPSTPGYAPLREWITAWMSGDNLAPQWLDPSCVILTNGSQGAVNLVSETFIDPGDVVLTESPTYPEALLAFQREGAAIVPVPIDEDGPIPEALEERVLQHKVKFFYTVVNFQNPSGCTTSDHRKAAILELARKHGFFILEDDPYRHLRYEGKPTRSYFEMAGEDRRVIYLGSFSKIVAPGVRCGWCAFPPPVRNKLLEVRLSLELCAPALTQCAVFEFLRDCDLEAHFGKLAGAYRSRRDALVRGLEDAASPYGLRLSVPLGGFFLWGTCPGIRDMSAFARYAALEKKVGFIPGRFFYPKAGEGEDTIRFSFAKVNPEQSAEGAKRFRQALEGYRANPCL